MRAFYPLALALAGFSSVSASASPYSPVADSAQVEVQARKTMMGSPEEAYRMAVDLERRVRGSEGDRQQQRQALARAYWIAGEALARMGRNEQAGKLLGRSREYARLTGNAKIQANALLSRGSVKQNGGNMAGALGDYQNAMHLFQTLQDTRSQSIALQYLGNLYSTAGDLKRAERYYRQAGETHSSDPRMTLALENNLGDLAMEDGRPEQAVPHLERAVAIARAISDEPLEVRVLDNLALAHLKRGEIGDAMNVVGQIRSILSRSSIPAPVQFETTLVSISLVKRDIPAARARMDRILRNLPGPADGPGDLDMHRLAYQVYKASGDTAKALTHLEAERRIRESTTALAISNKTALMAAQFDYANQELRIAKLKQEEMRKNIESERTAARHQRTIFVGGSVILLTLLSALCFILATLRRSRDRSRTSSEALERALAEVDAREIAEQKATERAEHDALTGLPNRRHLQERLRSRIEDKADGRQCSLLMLDLDRFKPINDIHGHDVGDAVLIQVARRLREVASSHKATAVRLGGDEFMLVLHAAPGDEAPAELARHLIEEVSSPYEIGERRLTIGTSIGISRRVQDGETVEDLLRSADIALYEAKNSGRKNFRFFDREMIVQMRHREDLENELRLAIQDDQIDTWFQPVHSFSAGRTSGFEALARWFHPQRGQISPDDFIPVAEDLGLIDEITSRVVRHACRAAREWPDDVTVSINLSPVLLRDSWIVTRIFGILSSEGLPPRRLIIEITEHAVIDDLERASEVIDAFRTSGIRVALDDFGKGYSSLSHLRQLSFDHMKLDASFVRTLHEKDSLTIATAVAGLGKALGLPVTAEGLENEQDAQIIQDLGFSYAQGYFYGRPMPQGEARIHAWPRANDDLPGTIIDAA